MGISTKMVLMFAFVTLACAYDTAGEVMKQFHPARWVQWQSAHFDVHSPSDDKLSVPRRLSGMSTGMCDLISTQLSCQATTSESKCVDKCAWESAKCNLDPTQAQGALSDPKVQELMKQAMTTCNTGQEECAGAGDGKTCEWNSVDNKCDLSGMYAATLMFGGPEGFAKMMALMQPCLLKAESACPTDSCVWEESSCNPNAATVLKGLGCEGSADSTTPNPQGSADSATPRTFVGYALLPILALALSASFA